MNAMQKSVTLAGALALALTLGGCGSEGDPCARNPLSPGCQPSPTPSPVTITETIVIYGDNGGFPAESWGHIPFAIPSAGTVAATVDWTFASSEVAIAMTDNSCATPEAAFSGQCSYIGTPNMSRTQKPKTVSGAGQAGPARLWIANFSNVSESMAVQITLTTTRSASAPIVLEPFSRSWVLGPNAALQAVRAFQTN